MKLIEQFLNASYIIVLNNFSEYITIYVGSVLFGTHCRAASNAKVTQRESIFLSDGFSVRQNKLQLLNFKFKLHLEKHYWF